MPSNSEPLTEEQEQTPLPWTANLDSDHGDYVIWGPGPQEFVANMGTEGCVAFDVAAANARLIVEAVNNHATLRAALSASEASAQELRRERDHLQAKYESACRGVDRNGDKAAMYFKQAQGLAEALRNVLIAVETPGFSIFDAVAGVRAALDDAQKVKPGKHCPLHDRSDCPCNEHTEKVDK